MRLLGSRSPVHNSTSCISFGHPAVVQQVKSHPHDLPEALQVQALRGLGVEVSCVLRAVCICLKLYILFASSFHNFNPILTVLLLHFIILTLY